MRRGFTKQYCQECGRPIHPYRYGYTKCRKCFFRDKTPINRGSQPSDLTIKLREFLRKLGAVLLPIILSALAVLAVIGAIYFFFGGGSNALQNYLNLEKITTKGDGCQASNIDFGVYWQAANTANSSCFLNTTTLNWTCVYADTSGLAHTVFKLEITKNEAFSRSVICTQYSSTPTGALTCTLPDLNHSHSYSMAFTGYYCDKLTVPIQNGWWN